MCSHVGVLNSMTHALKGLKYQIMCSYHFFLIEKRKSLYTWSPPFVHRQQPWDQVIRHLRWQRQPPSRASCPAVPPCSRVPVPPGKGTQQGGAAGASWGGAGSGSLGEAWGHANSTLLSLLWPRRVTSGTWPSTSSLTR